MIEPSSSSTIEWTTDCGWTTTSIWSGRQPNSQCASITSSPLFISVAESMVIFGPIFQVGCRSASSAVTASSDSRASERNGPPDAVRIEPRDFRCRAAVQTLVNGIVLAVHRQHRHAAAAGRIHDDRAGHDQHFLVRERDGLARIDGAQHRVEARRPRRCEQDDVGVGMRGGRDQSVGSARRRARLVGAGLGERPLGLLQRRHRRHRDRLGLEAADLLDEARHVLPRRERHDPEPFRMGVDHDARAL